MQRRLAAFFCWLFFFLLGDEVVAHPYAVRRKKLQRRIRKMLPLPSTPVLRIQSVLFPSSMAHLLGS